MATFADHDRAWKVVACIECRKRKRKCDGREPCSTCTQQSRSCSYVPKVESRKRRRVDEEYVQELEAQLAALRSILQSKDEDSLARIETKQRFDLFSSQLTCSDDESAEREPTTPNVPVENPMLPTSFDSAVDDLSSLVWKMSIGPGGQPSFTGPSGNFAALDEPRETEAVNSLHSIATRREEIDLDDADTREQLFGLFMEHINPYHQFLDNLSVFSSQSTYPLVGLSTEFRTNAVLAAGACYASSDRAALLGQAYATRAEEMMLRCCRDNPSLALVQGLAILTWRELSLGREHTAWVNNSLAAGIVVHLGLHVTGLAALSDQTLSATYMSSALRIRSFWCFFLIDRIATSILGRNCTVPWRRVRVPSYSSTFAAHELSLEQRVFDQQCRLWNIHDEYMDQIYAFDFSEKTITARATLLLSAHDALVKFHGQIDDFIWIKTNRCNKNVFVLELSYQTSILLIHRPFLRESTDSSTFRLALRSLKTASSAVARLIRGYRKHDSFVDAPPFLIHHFLTAGISILVIATSVESDLKRQTTGKLRVCIEALEEMCQRWSETARKAIVLLRRLAFKWAVVWALPVRLSNTMAAAAGTVQPMTEEKTEVEGLGPDSATVDWDIFDEMENWGTLDAAMFQSFHEVGSDAELRNELSSVGQFDWLFGAS